jgi:hypothetical protein
MKHRIFMAIITIGTALSKIPETFSFGLSIRGTPMVNIG